MDLAAQFFTIFAGLDRAHGWYGRIPVGVPGKKVKAPAATRHEPYTVALWQAHLAGEQGLGVVPIRADNTAVFGALDVDKYDTDLPALVTRINNLKLPLILCRTKSGGAHLYCFTKEPVPAALMRAKLKEWAAVLGYVNAHGEVDIEIFPKQDELTEDSPGSWINMPYFGGEDSLRYALGKRALTMEEFLAYVQLKQIADADHLAAIKAEGVTATNVLASVEETLPDAPPCLQRLASNGFPEGARNNGLFNLCVYAKKAFTEDEWQNRAAEFNQLFLQPPLPEGEVRTIIASVARRSYSYKCKDQPIVSCCDRKTCLKRKHGVGGGVNADDIGLLFGKMTKLLTKPVVWLWEIDGETIEFATADLMNQRTFHTRVIEVLSLWPPVVKPHEWQKLVDTATRNAEETKVPDDAQVAGQMWDQLHKFCMSRASGRSLDELLLGKPYTDESRSYFVSADFIAYLIQHRFPSKVNEREVYLILREKGLDHHRTNMKGKLLSYWSVPAFKNQTEDHTVPHLEPPEAM